MPVKSLIADLQPPERRVLHEQVLAQLVSGIRSGQLRPGERLLEVEIANRVGLSRGTVREAIRRLEQDGLVVSQPHKGTYVVDLSPTDVAEVYSLRLQLESYAARLACGHLTDATAAALTTTIERIAAAASRGDQNDQLQHDQRFHELLCEASGHRHLVETWSRLAIRLWLVNFTLEPIYTVDAVERARGHHRFVELLRHGSPAEAAAWIEHHIGNRAIEVVARLVERSGCAPVDPRILRLAGAAAVNLPTA